MIQQESIYGLYFLLGIMFSVIVGLVFYFLYLIDKKAALEREKRMIDRLTKIMESKKRKKVKQSE